MVAWVKEYEKATCDVLAFADGESLCREGKSYDVIFLDIDMDGMNGIETARKLRCLDKAVKIIYVTSYSDYVNGAFSVHAFSYLIKPVNRDVIFRQLDEVLSYTAPVRESPELDFQTETGLERFATDDIYYFEYNYRKIIMHTHKNKFRFYGKIADVLIRMEKYGFASPHKSFVVNLYHVKSIKGYELKMMNGDTVPLSQKKSPEFRRLHSRFLAKLPEEVDYE